MSFLPEVALLIDMFNMGPLRMARYPAPTRNAFGDYVDGSPTITNIDPIHVQTATGHTLDSAPERDRRTEQIRIYTKTRLRSADESTGSDVLEYNGRAYRVDNSENLNPHGGVWISHASLKDGAFP